jgi:preprotein translocase subunit SecG
MINILLTLHIALAICLIFVVIMQKTSADSISSLAGNTNNTFSSKATENFLYKSTIILGFCFFINSIALANLFSKYNKSIIIEQKTEKEVKVK